MKDTVILVTRNGLGSTRPADEDFGLLMLEKLFHTLEKEPEKPRAICFYTEGVRAVCQGSPHVLGLQLLQGMGVRILSCQTCLMRYGLMDQVAVGEIGGLTDVVRALDAAQKVITV